MGLHIEGWEEVLNAFTGDVFPMKDFDGAEEEEGYQYYEKTLLPQSSLPWKSIQRRGIKIPPPKQILQKLTILFAQIQTGSKSKNLLKKFGDKLSIHHIKQSRSQRKYTIIYSDQYNDEYDTHEFREKQDFWSI